MKNTGVITRSLSFLCITGLWKWNDVTGSSVGASLPELPQSSQPVVLGGFAPEVLIDRSLEILDSSVTNSDRLLDGDDSTCINPRTDMIWNQTLYLITAKIVTRSDKGKIIARFNDTVNCSDRQIFKTYKNTTSGSCGFYKGCDLLSQGNIDDNNENERQDCEFRCPCDGDGCEVALIDRTDEEVPICEISYN